jgi:hypothetical protein
LLGQKTLLTQELLRRPDDCDTPIDHPVIEKASVNRL